MVLLQSLLQGNPRGLVLQPNGISLGEILSGWRDLNSRPLDLPPGWPSSGVNDATNEPLLRGSGLPGAVADLPGPCCFYAAR
jgi:hypothetical protein